ncbi:MAG: TolC family protein [Elusimicrobia bacterium]|nr:TolC family protein [Elusimicrobiota bacterium]
MHLNVVKRLFGIILLLIIIRGVSYSDEILNSYLQIAYENNEEVKISKEQIKLAKMRVLNAARILGPNVYFEYRRSDGRSETDPYKQKGYGISAAQGIFEGGKKYFNLKKEMRSLDVVESRYDETLQALQLTVANIYYDMVLNIQKLKNYNELLLDIEDEFEIAEKKYNAGIMTQVDYMGILNLKEELLLERELTKNNIDLAKIDLGQKCGVRDLDDTYLYKGRLYKDLDVLNYSLKELKDIALKNRPELISARAIVDQTRYSLKSARGDDWPALSLEGFVGKSGEAYVEDELELATEWNVFANLQWSFWGNVVGYKYGERKTDPSEIVDISVRTQSKDHSIKLGLLSNMAVFVSKKEAEIVYMQAIKDFNNKEQEVMIDVERTYNNYVNYMRAVDINEKKVKLSTKQVSIIEKKKLLGETSSDEIIKTKSDHVNQQNAYLKALFNVIISKAELIRSCGVDVFTKKEGG